MSKNVLFMKGPLEMNNYDNVFQTVLIIHWMVIHQKQSFMLINQLVCVLLNAHKLLKSCMDIMKQMNVYKLVLRELTEIIRLEYA